MYSRNTANGRGRGIIPPYNYGGTVYSRALRDAQEEAQAAENVIQGHSLRMDSRRKKAEDAAAAKLKLTMDAAALDDRIRLLTEMEKEYEGF